jgi:RNA polymerase sigma-70 factor (ECF subfamily)
MDETTFAAFHATTYRPLWAYVRRAAGDAALADDVVQDAYLRLLQARTEGLAEPQLRVYLFRIATNLLRDYWRRTRREVPEDQADRDRPGPPPAEPLDIARMMNVGEKSVRVLLFRARRKLAAALTAKEVKR